MKSRRLMVSLEIETDATGDQLKQHFSAPPADLTALGVAFRVVQFQANVAQGVSAAPEPPAKSKPKKKK